MAGMDAVVVLMHIRTVMKMPEAKAFGTGEIQAVASAGFRVVFEQAINFTEQGKLDKGLVLFTLFKLVFPEVIEVPFPPFSEKRAHLLILLISTLGVQGYTNLALVLERLGRDAEALATLREVFTRYPDEMRLKVSMLHLLQREAQRL